MRNKTFIVGLVTVIIAIAVIATKFSRNNVALPQGGETKHSVPLDEIIGGGPPKDGIPPIDNPKFVSPAQANSFLSGSEPGIALDINGVQRFYPFQILVWHEIVNDTVNGKRVLVTYCPLCLSGIVFDPLVNGQRVEFGTSGKLWNSNLVMYDRKTDSLWSQILGEAIVGEMTGAQLAVLPSDMMRYENFKKTYPAGVVLSRETGAKRLYGQDPYGDYYTSSGTYFPVGKKDNRLGEKDFVLGIVVNNKAKAYWPPAVKKAGSVEDRFADRIIMARYEKDTDTVRLFEKKPNGELERINPFGAFWFSWFAAHPNTELLKTAPNADKAPGFNLKDYNGNTVNLADFQGRPVVINSWAAWCPFCRKELVDFAAAQKEFGDQVVIIAIDRAESLETANKYSDELGVTNDLVFLLDPSDSFYQSIGGFSMPETIFVDKNGAIVDHKRGPMDSNEIRERVKKIIH
ncbi:DUF3179 domain-containing protein [Candidatus Gottesmanbacteria bacterium]|nr:DUF3179 domain-containing protein [Candidatus Gottesmanbacteria bacterium]